MIALVTVFLLTLSAYAQSIDFSWERSTASGHDKFGITHSKNNTVIQKTSNWFDTRPDYRVGKFQVSNSDLLKPIFSELAGIEYELRAADEKLKTLGKSFNELNSHKAPHASYFRLNGYRVQTGSMLFPRLEKVAARMAELQLSLLDGVELDKNRKNFVFYKNGKEVKREEFSPTFFCQSPTFPTRCLAREWGVLYLK